jgi:nucleoside-diphosphate-sugar epimerase
MINKYKKILLVGGAGYIGTVLFNSLTKKGYKVKSIDNKIYGKKNIFIKNFKTKYNKEKSFLNFKSIEKDLRYTDYVVFLAGLVGDPITAKYPKESNLTNNKGTLNFLKNIKKFKIKKLLYISTCSNYGLSSSKKKLNEKSPLKPLSLYAKSKVDIEKYLLKNKKTLGYSFNILRFSTAFGDSPRMRFDLTINQFTRDIFFNKKVLIYDPDTWRPYCHVLDFSRAIDKILSHKKKNLDFEIFNVGNDNNNYSKLAMLKLIIKVMGKGSYQILKESKDKRNYKVDFSKIKKTLGFVTKYDLKYGIKEIVSSLKKNKTTIKKTDYMGNYEIIRKKK